MIFILFFLSAGFVFISHGLDKFSMPKHVSEKHFPTIQFIAKLFLSFALQLTILALVQFLVIETTQFNIFTGYQIFCFAKSTKYRIIGYTRHLYLSSFFNIFRSKTNHYPYIQDQKRTLPFEFTGL